MTPAEIKAGLKSLGLNQTQAAALLGYGNKSRVSEIETGKRNPSEAVVRLLRAYLDGYRPKDWPGKE
jgi:transcriptional regulator with XRE-family HTH domain